VIVPKTISDESLAAISAFRCLGRFPVLSYFHKTNKVNHFFYYHLLIQLTIQQAVIMRSGQPMVGTSSKRCKEDEKLINAVLGTGKRGYIIETRSQNLAQLAKSKGKIFNGVFIYLIIIFCLQVADLSLKLTIHYGEECTNRLIDRLFYMIL
jgi:putative uncharacterized protein (fragment)